MMHRLQRLDSEIRSKTPSRHDPIHRRRGPGAQHHRLSREELQRRWQFLLVKMRSLMAYYENRRRLIFILGLDAATLESSEPQGMYVLKNMMKGAVEETSANEAEVAPAQRRNHARIIGQEVMGKFLGRTEFTKGTPIEEVELCPHPTEDLKRRACTGGKKSHHQGPQVLKWFTCLRCHGRWERSVLQQNTNERLDDSDLIDFQCGHLGQTYLATYRGHPGFCHTVLSIINEEGLADQDPGLRRFGRYLLMKGDHAQLLTMIPPQGTPHTPENLTTVEQVEQAEDPADWGAIETDGIRPPSTDSWHDTTPLPMSVSDDERL